MFSRLCKFHRSRYVWYKPLNCDNGQRIELTWHSVFHEEESNSVRFIDIPVTSLENSYPLITIGTYKFLGGNIKTTGEDLHETYKFKHE